MKFSKFSIDSEFIRMYNNTNSINQVHRMEIVKDIINF